MSYRVDILPDARKELAQLPPKIRLQVNARIKSLASNPFPLGAKPLRGVSGLFSLRSGRYRIVYQVHHDQLVVVIVRIGHRKHVYRRLP